MVSNSIQSLFIFSHASDVTPGLKVWVRQMKISISWMDLHEFIYTANHGHRKMDDFGDPLIFSPVPFGQNFNSHFNFALWLNTVPPVQMSFPSASGS